MKIVHPLNFSVMSQLPWMLSMRTLLMLKLLGTEQIPHTFPFSAVGVLLPPYL